MRRYVCVATAALFLGLAGFGCSSGSNGETGGDDGGAPDTGTHVPDGSAAHDGAIPYDAAAGDDAHTSGDAGIDGASTDDGSADAAHADGSTSSDGGTDASVNDASANDAMTDAATSDANADGAADGGVCAPADESGFTPVWHAPNPHSAACTQPQIDAYHQCLKDGQTIQNPPSCAPFGGATASAANKACAQCILSQDTAAHYGPIIVHKGTIEMNVAGCIATAENDPNGTGCAGTVQAVSECKLASCAASCHVTDNASFTTEQQCEAAAAAGTCKTFEDAASACFSQLGDAGAATAKCTAGQNFDDLYDAIVPIFCGP